MSKYDGYHTALRDPEYKGDRYAWARTPKGPVFTYDLFLREYPTEFNSCDVFYSDLPWRSGFNEFEGRAGRSGREYLDFISAAKDHVRHYRKPTVFVTGKHVLFDLDPDAAYPTTLNGQLAMAMCWGLTLSRHKSERSILTELSERFSVAGDYCCGYGRTGEYFDAFVMSDYNESCVGYVAEKFR